MRGNFAVVPLAIVATAMLAQEPRRPLPLDPLTSEERGRALTIARENGRVRELIGPNEELETIYTEFISVKRDQSGEPRGRYADVLFYRFDQNIGIRALVDLEVNGVTDIARVPGKSVPLGAADVERAARLAQEDPQVRALFGEQLSSFRVLTGPITRESQEGNFIEGLHTVGVRTDDPCTTDRCVTLLFSAGDRYLFNDRSITVDLTKRRVMLRGGRR
jgi:hypothetical protein